MAAPNASLREQAAVPLDAYVPNDPMWPQQWGPPAINAPDAWDILLGDHGVRWSPERMELDVGP
jgi:hypothetical protein